MDRSDIASPSLEESDFDGHPGCDFATMTAEERLDDLSRKNALVLECADPGFHRKPVGASSNRSRRRGPETKKPGGWTTGLPASRAG